MGFGWIKSKDWLMGDRLEMIHSNERAKDGSWKPHYHPVYIFNCQWSLKNIHSIIHWMLKKGRHALKVVRKNLYNILNITLTLLWKNSARTTGSVERWIEVQRKSSATTGNKSRHWKRRSGTSLKVIACFMARASTESFLVEEAAVLSQ